MYHGTPRRRARRGLAILAASVAGLALAGPGSAQLGATQSQSGSNGVLQAVVTNVQVTDNTVRAPVSVQAPVRVLSPGDDAGGSSAGASAGGAGGGHGSTSQSQSGRNGAAQLGVTNVQVAGTTVQAPVAVVLPIRVLSPGEDRGEASAMATTGGGSGSAEQSQNGENGALQALLTSLQVAGTTVQTPIAVYAPVRVLSPGINGGGATASADTGGGGSADQTQDGENGAAQAGVTNAQIAGNAAQAPVEVTAPVRVLSPGDTTTGPGGGRSPGGGGDEPGNGGSGPGGGELGAEAGGTASGSVGEILAAVTGGGSLPYTGAPLALLVLLGASLLLAGARLRAVGTESRP